MSCRYTSTRSGAVETSRLRGMCAAPGRFEPTMKIHTGEPVCGDTYGTSSRQGGCGRGCQCCCQCCCPPGPIPCPCPGPGPFPPVPEPFIPAYGTFVSDMAQTLPSTGAAVTLNAAVVAAPSRGLTLTGGGVQVEYGGFYQVSYGLHAATAATAAATVYLTVDGVPIAATAVPMNAGEFQSSGAATIRLSAGDFLGLGTGGSALTLAAGVNNAFLVIQRVA